MIGSLGTVDSMVVTSFDPAVSPPATWVQVLGWPIFMISMIAASNIFGLFKGEAT